MAPFAQFAVLVSQSTLPGKKRSFAIRDMLKKRVASAVYNTICIDRGVKVRR